MSGLSKKDMQPSSSAKFGQFVFGGKTFGQTPPTASNYAVKREGLKKTMRS